MMFTTRTTTHNDLTRCNAPHTPAVMEPFMRGDLVTVVVMFDDRDNTRHAEPEMGTYIVDVWRETCEEEVETHTMLVAATPDAHEVLVTIVRDLARMRVFLDSEA